MMYAIVAMCKDSRAIGMDDAMLYHLPKDLKYFKETTQGHTIVMGAKTYLSLPKRPLPNRKNIVLSHKRNFEEDVLVLRSVEELLAYEAQHPEEEIFICGGSSLYEQCMPYVQRLYVTEIEEKSPAPANRFFPEIDSTIWEKVQFNCVEDTLAICFTIWERKK